FAGSLSCAPSRGTSATCDRGNDGAQSDAAPCERSALIRRMAPAVLVPVGPTCQPAWDQVHTAICRHLVLDIADTNRGRLDVHYGQSTADRRALSRAFPCK